ncbi:hypothetical protein [Caballeronia sp. LZ035]|uniref:hypothetical protein n=1 Tax=Caballeronia sp. LZ035 TaxID=3038568 RepID=UPI0028571DFE|nr:hypothetical protein [Caballeronia sp. LZ035]MDR5760873.1 hypothetical protein [Caballeronia sp. LZ035]
MQTWQLTHRVDRQLIAVREDWLCFRSHSRASLLDWQASRAPDFDLGIDPALRSNSKVQRVAQQALFRVEILYGQRSELTSRLPRARYGENCPETSEPVSPEAVNSLEEQA